jgi:hypothetical protein
MLALRHPWARGQGWQVDWVLSEAGQAEAKASGRYLGEPWMLSVVQALLEVGGAAVVSLTRGEGWEEGAMDALEALDLPGFEGALLLSAPLAEVARALPVEGVTARDMGDGALWLVSEGWFGEQAWGAWPGQGAPPSLPWMGPLLEEGLEEEDGEDLLVIDAFGAQAEIGEAGEACEAAEVQARDGLARFIVEVEALGGRLARCPRVLVGASARVAVDERALRLMLCAQRRRRLGEPLGIGVADLLHAHAHEAAQLQRQMLGAVYWEAPQGQVRLVWSELGERRQVSLAFSRPVSEEQPQWMGEGWQLPWVEALARSFGWLEVLGAGHLGGWLPRFIEGEADDAFALTLRRRADGGWSGQCAQGWFGCGPDGRRWDVVGGAVGETARG